MFAGQSAVDCPLIRTLSESRLTASFKLIGRHCQVESTAFCESSESLATPSPLADVTGTGRVTVRVNARRLRVRRWTPAEPGLPGPAPGRSDDAGARRAGSAAE